MADAGLQIVLNVMRIILNYTGLVMAVAFMSWMMWPAKEMNLISSAVHMFF